ncbi:unnamed protein product [Didymodactylos carnosus]|uniref:Uncharacterized protein n=1 Tax=Didymodactylos carnosus TaxID=1234261 RepID=A0A815MLH8_9BILA|nr:unnamed protein product [Didymodactylos carnosus]CAF1421261.1 unnamed protein product [Didymodactylos carnosus]CAF3806081.1 unnamed protein product [Didymodactylos carnosus]CAF4304337.1 unnamed protein product [Didymodactylos carnosus]
MKQFQNQPEDAVPGENENQERHAVSGANENQRYVVPGANENQGHVVPGENQGLASALRKSISIPMFLFYVSEYITHTVRYYNFNENYAESIKTQLAFRNAIILGLDLFAYSFKILYFSCNRNYTEPLEEQNGENSPLIPSTPTGGELELRQNSYYENLVCVCLSLLLHILNIIIILLINLKHETTLCQFSTTYMISIIENILIFEVLHLGLDLIVRTKAHRAIMHIRNHHYDP